jgi:DNA primase
MDYDPIAYAENRWHIHLKHHCHDEYVGPCPFCSGGEDRFHVWRDKGNYWCRQCGIKGFVDEDADDHERRLRILEARQREIERKQAELEARMTALEKMHACRDHLLYHRQMSDEAILYWNQQGMLYETIERYLLGYCQRCPTDYNHRPSYTIPVISNGKLWNIRHRLVGADNGDKYRPHLAGLPNVLFNADYLRSDNENILIVEGEKKSIVAAQAGFPNVGVMGKAGFNKAWVSKFAPFKRVNVCYDPDAIEQAAEVAKLFGERGRVVYMPHKFDDLMTIYGATMDDIQAMIDLGRRV